MSTIHPKLSSCNDSEPVIQRQLEAISNDINMIKEVVCGKLYVFARMKDRTLNIGFTDDLPTRKDYWESKGFKFIDSTYRILRLFEIPRQLYIAEDENHLDIWKKIMYQINSIRIRNTKNNQRDYERLVTKFIDSIINSDMTLESLLRWTTRNHLPAIRWVAPQEIGLHHHTKRDQQVIEKKYYMADLKWDLERNYIAFSQPN